MNSRRIGCEAFRRHLARQDRRSFIKAGLLGTTGLSLSDLLRMEAAAAQAGAPVKREHSVIILWMRGGPSHIDMWDMKPDAPVEFRGDFKPISTNVPGIQICEHLPRSARIMDKWSIVRSLHHRPQDGNAGHSDGDQICFTGYKAGPDADQNIYPSIGSVVARQLQEKNRGMPSYVMVPRMVPGTDSAYLGPAYRPFESRSDPAGTGPFKVPDLEVPQGLSIGRVDDRVSLLKSLDQLKRNVDVSGDIKAMDQFNQQALDMVTGAAAQKAFDLDAEPQAIRDRYGYPAPYKSRMRAGGDRPQWSQRVLLARRLIEAGVRLVTVDLRWWDTHDDNFWALKNGFLPPFDQAYAALIQDLDERGLLDSTMVIAWGEIGRSPKISATAGRDHWNKAMSAAVAGGGIQGGRVIGATDPIGGDPADNPKIPHDMLATMYRHLGVDTQASYLDYSGRPIPVLNDGAPIDELF